MDPLAHINFWADHGLSTLSSSANTSLKPLYNSDSVVPITPINSKFTLEADETPLSVSANNISLPSVTFSNPVQSQIYGDSDNITSSVSNNSSNVIPQSKYIKNPNESTRPSKRKKRQEQETSKSDSINLFSFHKFINLLPYVVAAGAIMFVTMSASGNTTSKFTPRHMPGHVQVCTFWC